MLLIRKEQFRALEAARHDTLVPRVAEYLSAMDKARGSQWTEAELMVQTHRAVKNGLSFFRNDADVLRYCKVVVERQGGWTEEAHPPAAVSILNTRAIPPSRRIENFDRWASRRSGAPRAR